MRSKTNGTTFRLSERQSLCRVSFFERNTSICDCFVLQFDLVCDKAIYGTVSSSLIFVGWIVGALFVGTLADKFGRKIMVFSFGFFCALFSLLSAFPNAFWLFALFRFIVGFSIGMYIYRESHSELNLHSIMFSAQNCLFVYLPTVLFIIM